MRLMAERHLFTRRQGLTWATLLVASVVGCSSQDPQEAIKQRLIPTINRGKELAAKDSDLAVGLTLEQRVDVVKRNQDLSFDANLTMTTSITPSLTSLTNGRFGEPHSRIIFGSRFFQEPTSPTDQFLALSQYLDTRDIQWKVIQRYVNTPSTILNTRAFEQNSNQASGESPYTVLYLSCRRLRAVKKIESQFTTSLLPLEKPAGNPADTIYNAYLASIGNGVATADNPIWRQSLRRILPIVSS